MIEAQHSAHAFWLCITIQQQYSRQKSSSRRAGESGAGSISGTVSSGPSLIVVTPSKLRTIKKAFDSQVYPWTSNAVIVLSYSHVQKIADVHILLAGFEPAACKRSDCHSTTE